MEMSPKAIVAELDRYIIGQSEAKKPSQSHSETDIVEAVCPKKFETK